jgi:hypothetical protein
VPRASGEPRRDSKKTKPEIGTAEVVAEQTAVGQEVEDTLVKAVEEKLVLDIRDGSQNGVAG